jgi:predicted HicB family RNase H-like nuclease
MEKKKKYVMEEANPEDGSYITMDTKKKYFILEVTPDDHALIKMKAARLGISIKLWIMRAIAEKIKREEEREKRNC